MKIGKEPREIWNEYLKGKTFNTSINLYDTVEQNENFVNGKQWENVNAPDLEKPVFNFLKRIVMYFVSMVVSDDVAANLRPFVKSDESENVANIISAQIPKILEQTDAKTMFRDLIRDGAVDGDSYIYAYFDIEKESGQEVMGDIELELIENVKLIFGNPYEVKIQKQPYLIVVQRKPISDVVEEASLYGIDLDGKLNADSDDVFREESSPEDLVTCLIKFWKEDGSIYSVKVTQDEVIRPVYDTGLTLYPISSFIWNKARNIYHGISAVTEFIPNQIAVNKLYAMAIHSAKTTAFPMIVYDKDKFRNGFTNKVGKAIGIKGDVNTAIWRAQGGADMSTQVMQLISDTIDKTRDFMGASDSALGNVRPDNTSAIIVAREATAVPLQLQQRSFYQMVEGLIRIFIDIMRCNYGVRDVTYEDSQGEEVTTVFDFGTLDNFGYALNVDIGPASYWSEITNSQRWDNLLTAGIISDHLTYLEGIPSSQLPQKAMLIRKMRQQREAAEAGGMQGLMPGMEGMMPDMQGTEAIPQGVPMDMPVEEQTEAPSSDEIDLNRVLEALSDEELAALSENPELLEQILNS